jgi:tetratricopeptide (TPR) repeat protein
MRFILACILTCLSLQAYCGLPAEEDLLKRIANARSDEQKLKFLGDLADFYYLHRADKKGDSVLQLQLIMAESSADKNQILKILFSDIIVNIPPFSSLETFDRTLGFIQKGIDYAAQIHRPDYEALGYIRKASVLSKRGLYDEAIDQTTIALPILTEEQDSIKAVLYLELGRIYLLKQDAVKACKHINTAYDLAYSMKNIKLQSAAHHRYFDLYQFLEDSILAKKTLLESLTLNINANDKEGQLLDYIALGRLTDQEEYLNKASNLAKEFGSARYNLTCKKMVYYWLMVVKKDATQTLRFLRSNPDLNEFFLNQGLLYTWNLGDIFYYGNVPDSALKYYREIHAQVENTFHESAKISWYQQIGNCYFGVNALDSAAVFLEKALSLGNKLKAYKLNATITEDLSKVYAKLGNYEKAYSYNLQHVEFEKQANELLKDREIAILGVEREKKMHEKDLEELQKEALRTRNLQYIGITIATIAFFVFLFLIGMFPVSRTATRMLSFFAFICLFEFIILLIDNWVHHAAHGEPLKVWLAKVGIIAILLPLHHYLDHLAYVFLTSHKLEKLRNQFSVKKIVNKIKLSEHKVVDTKTQDPASVEREEPQDTVA